MASERDLGQYIAHRKKKIVFLSSHLYYSSVFVIIVSCLICAITLFHPVAISGSRLPATHSNRSPPWILIILARWVGKYSSDEKSRLSCLKFVSCLFRQCEYQWAVRRRRYAGVPHKGSQSANRSFAASLITNLSRSIDRQ